jgi:hypothetical protein
MPSESKKQQMATAIAEHAPEKLYARNRGLLKMTHKQLHEFAATKRKGLPTKVRHKRKMSSGGAVIGNLKPHSDFRGMGIKYG